MSGAGNYASRHLSNNDYYSKGETITGQWMGRGAQLLGLEGEVTMQQFDAIRQGHDPQTGEFLRQRKSADRFVTTELTGELEQRSSARNLYDFTVSAPKGVSVLSLYDSRLIQAHRTAVVEMATEMEGLAGSYVRKDDAQGTRKTSNLVTAAYNHDTSRELDPQLHTHLVAGNLTFDAFEGKWKALAAFEIYQHRAYLTEVYRNALAREVMALGYEIENLSEHGQDNGFNISGVEQSTRDKFSQRSAQRDAAIRDFMIENGRPPSDNEIAILVRDTRAKDLAEISTAEVKVGQMGRMSPDEHQRHQAIVQTAAERCPVVERVPASLSLAYASEHIFERVSVTRDQDLKMEALIHGRGRVELEEVKAAVLTQIATGAMLTARGEVATQETLDRERRMVATVNAGLDKYRPLGLPDFEVSANVRPEQRAAIEAILGSTDLVFNLSGAAGVGKTTTLKEVERGLNENRRSVMVVAPSAGAVDVLRKDGFADATTIARLLVDPSKQEELRGQVLIIDEAGMVGSKDFSALVELADKKGARVLTSGDTAQIKSVSEGDAVRVLECESKLRGVSLRQVQRQLNKEYREAVEALRTNPADAFSKFEAMGAIREVDWRVRAHEVSKAYRELSVMPNVKGNASSVLVVAKTHDEISSITFAIRSDRKKAFEIADGEQFVKHSALNWTEAQKKQTQKYEAGQVLGFHKSVKGIAGKNEGLEVIRSDKRGITARRENGETVHVTARQANAFAVFEKQDIEVSAGDKLLFRVNWPGKRGGFRATNGELVTVASVDRGAIKLEDGRQLPTEYRKFSHGYAVTANYSQGKTVDRGAILDDRMAQDKGYVAKTRFRESIVIITSDKLALQEAMMLSGDRQSASELEKRAAYAAPIRTFNEDDLFRAYEEAQRQMRQATKQAVQIDRKQEITHHVEQQFEYHISL